MRTADIGIDDTCNYSGSNVKKLLENMILRYGEKVSELNEQMEELKYESAPSGEVNESMIPIDLIDKEIDVLEDMIDDIDKILVTGIFL